MKIEIFGLEEAIDSIRSLPPAMNRGEVLSRVASQFQQKLSAATPVGYSGKLQRSVMAEANDDQGVVGYEEGVETAGNPELDSVTRPRTRGRSVLWVHTKDLRELATQEFEDFQDAALSVMESAFMDQINARS